MLPDVAGLVLHQTPGYQLLGPVHVAGGKSIAASGQLGANVWPPELAFVGRGQGAVGVTGIQAGLLLVAGVDAGALHKVTENVKRKRFEVCLHLLKQFDRMQRGPRQL